MHWIYGPTPISMRRTALERILPMPESSYLAWQSRADDCLVLGSSMSGCCKFYLAEALVRYRIHDHNMYAGKSFNDFGYRLRRSKAIGMLNAHFWNGLSQLTHTHLIVVEFSSGEGRSLQDVILYLRIIRQLSVSFLTKIKLSLSILRSFSNLSR